MKNTNDTTKKKTESETIKQLLNIITDAQHNLSMIDRIREFGIDMAKDHMSEGDYESAYMNLGDAVHFDYLEENLKKIKKIIEENTIVRLGGASFRVSSMPSGKERPPEELN
jgi:hypothetical protein